MPVHQLISEGGVIGLAARVVDGCGEVRRQWGPAAGHVRQVEQPRGGVEVELGQRVSVEELAGVVQQDGRGGVDVLPADQGLQQKVVGGSGWLFIDSGVRRTEL